MDAEPIQKHTIEIEDNKVTELTSPLELDDQRKRLAPTEIVSIDEIGVVSGEVQQYILPTGADIEGVGALDVVIGGDHTNARARILDLTHTNKYADVGEGDLKKRMRRIGKNSQGGDVCVPANFAVVILDGEGTPVSMQPLIPDRVFTVGRDSGKIGGNSLPATVSRDHLGLRVDQAGKLTIENRNPSNGTYIEQTPDNIERGQDYFDDSFSSDEVDLGSVELMADVATTSEWLGVAGEVIGRVSSSHPPYIDSLIVRRLNPQDKSRRLMIVEKRDDTLTVRALDDDSEIILPGMHTDNAAILHLSGDSLRVADCGDFGESGVSISVLKRRQRSVYKAMRGEMDQNLSARKPTSRPNDNARIAYSTLDGDSGYISRR